MFEITITTLLMAYLGLTLLSVLSVWTYTYLRAQKRAMIQNEQLLYQCEFCLHAYLEQGAKKVNRCPQCGLMNKSNVYKQKSS